MRFERRFSAILQINIYAAVVLLRFDCGNTVLSRSSRYLRFPVVLCGCSIIIDYIDNICINIDVLDVLYAF